MSAWLEAIHLAGFTASEADRFFGKPDPAVIDGLRLQLRPPAQARAAFLAAHAALLRDCDG